MEVWAELLCAIALFLFGMSLLGESMGALLDGKDWFRRLPPKGGFAVGAGLTALLQSSSAATVLTVSLCDAGVLSGAQAAGVIAGANVGTTSTAWLLCLGWSAPEAELVLLALVSGAGLLLYLTGWRRVGAALMGLFLLLSGMRNLVSAAGAIGSAGKFAQVVEWAAHPLIGVAAGCAFTAVVQSSSASVGMLQALAATGSIGRSTALPILIGINIGTCSTTLLSAVSCGGAGRSAALFHLRFNLVGALLFMPLCFFLDRLAGAVTPVEIAAFHTLFNLVTSVVVMGVEQKRSWRKTKTPASL